MKRTPLFLFALIASLLATTAGYCRHGEFPEFSKKEEELEGPWFTGPLLSSSPHIVPLGYINFEPYLVAQNYYGEYDKNWHPHSTPRTQTITPIFFFQMGLTKDLDFQFNPQFFYQQSQGASATRLGDTSVALDYQLLWDKKGEWWPAIKLFVREFFPTGKYQHFDPKKNFTDDAGAGVFETDFGVVIGRIVHLTGIHYLSPRFTFIYGVSSNVHLEGFNNYGGGFGTKGTAKVGSTFTTVFGTELNISKNWALAVDIAYLYGNKTTFHGKRGFNADGTQAVVGGPSFNQVSVAPALEYNFSEEVGIIAGAWFTVAGRNDFEFASGVLAINWYFNFRKGK
ncbi:MAG: hypothetical protein HYX48_02390 [Chlamydiales bacterium]|nr:hypothetical protein [Chlamydiales bacterium]